MMEHFHAAIVGCGSIAEKYARGIAAIPGIKLHGCTDQNGLRAKAFAEAHGCGHWKTLEALLSAPDIDLIVNLTDPLSHYAVNKAALQAGKNLFCEKPFALSLDQAGELVTLAQANALTFCVAPDTFLRPDIVEVKTMIARGVIGRPIGFFGAQAYSGHESWHPRPDYYYQPGAGPMLDMGPYFVSHLVEVLGAVRSVFASGYRSSETRFQNSPNGTRRSFPVAVLTHYNVILDMAAGLSGQFVASYDTLAHTMPLFEIYGMEGTLRLSNLDEYHGRVTLFRKANDQWRDVVYYPSPLPERARGLALMNMVEGRTAQATAARALNTLAILFTIEASANSAQKMDVMGE